MTKPRQKQWKWLWLRSEHFWCVMGGLIFLIILLVKQEQWCGIASITCFALSLGLHIVDRLPQPKPTVQPTVKMYR